MIDAHSNAPAWWRQADALRHFAVFLLIEGPLKVYSLWRSTAANFEAELAVIPTAKNITKPLFQDYSREGRIIGIFLRLGRIVIGSLIQIILAVAFSVLAVAWMLLPLYVAYQITANLGAVITGSG